MKATIPVLGALLVLAGSASAQSYYRTGVSKTPILPAPDMCGPGFVTIWPDGSIFCPSYNVYPPFEAFNGILPDKNGKFNDKGGRPYGYHYAPCSGGNGNQGFGPGPGGPGQGPGGPMPMPGYTMGPPAPGLPPPGFSPGLPAPGAAPPLPAPGYAPVLPSPGYPGYAPPPVPLPTPGYEPPPAQCKPAGFPVHPFVRSPRDFFMWSDVMEDRLVRSQRPSLVP
jgi:hypothetical protein